jgi:hypothetical protein
MKRHSHTHSTLDNWPGRRWTFYRKSRRLDHPFLAATM